MSATAVCRCCLLRPPDMDLRTPYTFLGKTEVYCDMLKECFDIHLSITPLELLTGICEACVIRLRDATDFKHQVQASQDELLANPRLVEVKEETGPKLKEEIFDSDETNDHLVMDVKEEMSDFNDPEDDEKLADILGLQDITVKRKKRSVGDKTSDRKSKKRAGSLKITFRRRSNRSKLSIVPKGSSFSVLSTPKKLQSNIKNILKYSNCTPFFTKTLTGIICAFCKETTNNLDELKNHIDTAHTLKDIKKTTENSNNLAIKMDITDLKCTLCETNFNTIAYLKKHLIKEHNVKFFPDVHDYILEFKLTDTEMLNCALCNSTYETFKMLLQHMNGHYRNFICEVCDLGFINLHRLKTHQRTHETGNFQCSFCEKVFPTRVRQMCHEKYTHNSCARYKTNCPHCNESFNSYYQRNRHMFKEHNALAATYKCNICDKSYILKSKLTSHIKKVHLMERNHTCPECGQGFFIKQSLDEHMIAHNGERVFQCTVCHKAYARKKTLREHMRIHNNDRRFKCEVCGSAFVQKCSLKGHMLSNHGVSLTEFENAKALTTPVSLVT